MDITWGSLWRTALVVGMAGVLFLVRDVLVAIFLSVVISTGLAPFVDFLEKRSVPRLLGTILVYLSIVLVFGLLIYVVVPIAMAEFEGLFENLVALTNSIFSFTGTKITIDTFQDNIGIFSSAFFFGGASFFEAASSFFGGVALAITVAFVSFYLSLSRNGVEWFLRAIMPESYEEKVLSIFKRSKRRIGFWLQTQIFLSLVVGLLSFIGLALLGVEHALILGMAAGVFEIIPFVGPVFAGSIAVLVALSDSFSLGLYVLVLFAVIQQIESQFIIPSLFQKAIGLHPVVVIAAFMIGFTLLGFIGLILAVPGAVILQEILNDWVSIKDHRRALRESGIVKDK